MLKHHRRSVVGCFFPCLLVLSACQTPPAKTAGASVDPAGSAGLAAVPDCAAGISATLSDGVHIGYKGSDPSDPDRCMLDWSGRSYTFYFGLWSATPNAPMTDEARAAFRTALTGPVGTEASFDTAGARLWRRVTVTHVANTTIDVAGAPRPALELRVVRHDAEGRPEVRAETRYMVDRETGVMLRSEIVTPMADGDVMKTTSWRIGTIERAG
jgi:hypothetical protein